MSSRLHAIGYCALAALIMAYGWGYRGTVGHEAGAMVPGALLGLALCVASSRDDWRRRAAMAGLFGAAGWAWGGSLSYMEQTFYTLSDSWPDVLYGYAVIFFLGAMWAGCGGAVLGLAFTEPRSHLESLARAFAVLCGAYLLVYLYFLFDPAFREAYETFTVRHFHDGDWLSATIALLVGSVYWFVRPKDRKAAALFVAAALAWWVGYGLLTKLGGLRLAPLHRSESWGGVLGVLAVFIAYTARRKNYAALMMSLYGCVGGGMAFAIAVFVHHPLTARWGPLQDFALPIPAWRTAEITFGFFMGLAMALAALRLQRGNVVAPEEDSTGAGLDVFAVFTVLVALPWVNFRRHFARVLNGSPAAEGTAFLGLDAAGWYFALGALATAPVLYALYRYYRGDRSFVPRSAAGKGAAVMLLLVWLTLSAQLLDQHPARTTLLGNLTLWLPAIIATGLTIFFVTHANLSPLSTGHTAMASDRVWRPGKRFALASLCAPLVVLGAAAMSMAIQDGPMEGRSRLRFGPDAYWRQTARLEGTWTVLGVTRQVGEDVVAGETAPFAQLEFDAYRNVTAISTTGTRVEAHRWFLKNQYIWLDWYAKDPTRPNNQEVPLEFRGDHMYVRQPGDPSSAPYLVLAREQD